jgi:hypothetical protein
MAETKMYLVIIYIVNLHILFKMNLSKIVITFLQIHGNNNMKDFFNKKAFQ